MSPYDRGRIEAAAALGSNPAKIAQVFKYSRGAIRGTLALEILRTNGESLPRSGRPPIYTERTLRAVLNHVRKYPKDTYQEVRKAYGTEIKNTRIRQLLKENNITKWRCKSHPELTQVIVNLRYNWCKPKEH